MQPSAAAPAKAPAGGQSINSAFKPVQSSEPSPFKSAQSADPSPFKSSQASEPSPFKSAQPAVSAAPAAAMEPSNADIDDLEAEIEAFTPSSGPVVPPGIFAPPPKPGN